MAPVEVLENGNLNENILCGLNDLRSEWVDPLQQGYTRNISLTTLNLMF